MPGYILSVQDVGSSNDSADRFNIKIALTSFSLLYGIPINRESKEKEIQEKKEKTLIFHDLVVIHEK